MSKHQPAHRNRKVLSLAGSEMVAGLPSILRDVAAQVQDVWMWVGLLQPVTLSSPQDLSHSCPQASPLMERRYGGAAYSTCYDFVSAVATNALDHGMLIAVLCGSVGSVREGSSYAICL